MLLHSLVCNNNTPNHDKPLEKRPFYLNIWVFYIHTDIHLWHDLVNKGECQLSSSSITSGGSWVRSGDFVRWGRGRNVPDRDLNFEFTWRLISFGPYPICDALMYLLYNRVRDVNVFESNACENCWAFWR